MFSPSSLVQSMIQRSSVSSPKPVELMPGQVFRGTVIRQYPENMALVQIGGIKVRAKLEAQLETGQKAWLQVQPDSDVVTLKVLDTPTAGGGKEASLESLIRSLGLPETKESRVIVQALVNANLPVTREAVQAFAGVAQRLGLDESTVKAFVLAMKRNLPLTPDTVAGLQAFLSEKPLSQAVQTFLQQASLFVKGNEQPAAPKQTAAASQSGQSAAGANLDVRQLVNQIREKLAGLPVLLGDAQGAEGRQPAAAGQALGNRAADVNQPPNPGSAGPQARGPVGDKAQGTAPNGGAASAIQQQGSAALPARTSVSPDLAAASARAGESAAAQNAAAADWQGDQPVQGNAARLHPPIGNPAAQSKESPAMQVPTSTNGTANTAVLGQQQAQAAGTSPAAAKPKGQQMVQPASVRPAADAAVSPPLARNPILEFLQQLGIAHERELMAQSFSPGSWEAGTLKQMETVKSLLLQLTQASSQSIPLALREAADQLLQQVTGQQLMLLSPSNQVLSQVVMQIPLRTDHGEETAYVQIESQKKAAGQLDAENCRLFFHLQLQELGTTMIDVNIVNKIVNLQIYNDTPGLEALAQAMRDGFAEQLQEAGYHLSAMRVQAIPEQQSRAVPAAGSAATSWMADYKGVDLRI